MFQDADLHGLLSQIPALSLLVGFGQRRYGKEMGEVNRKEGQLSLYWAWLDNSCAMPLRATLCLQPYLRCGVFPVTSPGVGEPHHLLLVSLNPVPLNIRQAVTPLEHVLSCWGPDGKHAAGNYPLPESRWGRALLFPLTPALISQRVKTM